MSNSALVLKHGTDGFAAYLDGVCVGGDYYQKHDIRPVQAAKTVVACAEVKVIKHIDINAAGTVKAAKVAKALADIDAKYGAKKG